MIQYSAPLMLNSTATEYWMPAFRGHDNYHDTAFILKWLTPHSVPSA